MCCVLWDVVRVLCDVCSSWSVCNVCRTARWTCAVFILTIRRQPRTTQSRACERRMYVRDSLRTALSAHLRAVRQRHLDGRHHSSGPGSRPRPRHRKRRHPAAQRAAQQLTLTHTSEPTRLSMNAYAVLCLKKKNKQSIHHQRDNHITQHHSVHSQTTIR